MISRIIVSAVLVIVGFVLHGVVRASIKKKVKAQTLKPQSALLARKITTVFTAVAVAIALGLVWGVAPRNIWVSLASVATLVAIGFFAVWCILSNIVAGVILLISRPFDIGDEVVILPEDIHGTLVNITSLFLVLEDNEGDIVTIPSNLVFQRIVRKVKRKDGF